MTEKKFVRPKMSRMCLFFVVSEACHNKRNSGKLHGNISWNGYGNAIICRYGGYFEEDIRWVYGIGESCAVLERLAMVEGWECVNPWNQH